MRSSPSSQRVPTMDEKEDDCCAVPESKPLQVAVIGSGNPFAG